MFIQRKPFLRNINRVRVSEGRDLEKGLRLDRNEKVDVWPKDFLTHVFQSKPNCFLSVYPECGDLYHKLGKFLQVEESQLMLTSGIDGGLKILFEIMTAPGDQVGVFNPTYAMYKVYSNLFQTQLTEIGYRPDLTLDEAQLEAFLNQKPVMLFVPNPNQPIESALTLAQLDQLAIKTHEKNCLLVIDEAYFMFGCDTGLPLLKKYEHVVILRTFSKGFGVPSIRLGFMISTEENMKILAKTRLAHESNALSTAVAEYLLDNYGMIEEYVSKVVEGRNYIKSEMAKMGYATHGGAGNFLLIDLHAPDVAAQTVRSLRDRFIYVKGPWPVPWDRYITVTLGPAEMMKRFVHAMREIKSGASL